MAVRRILQRDDMKILFLDDMEIRHKAFARAAIGHEVIAVKTAQEAIQALREEPRFDYVSLDHDLSEEHYETMKTSLSEACASVDCPISSSPHVRQLGCPGTNYTPGTGMDVVDYIVSTMPKEKLPRRVVVHSFNPRAEEMVARLRDSSLVAEWKRFHWK